MVFPISSFMGNPVPVGQAGFAEFFEDFVVGHGFVELVHVLTTDLILHLRFDILFCMK